MKVFISWSGDVSKQLADALSKWLPKTLQYVKPYFSPDDIEKGSRWDSEISQELKASTVCIIALTRQCLDSKWIMFEAGAISTSHDKARVCAILFGIKPIEIVGPLQRYQSTEFSKEEIRRLLITINSNAGDRMLGQDVLDDAFETRWPELESKVRNILQTGAPVNKPAERDQRSLLEEVVGVVRSLQMEQSDLHDAVDYIVKVAAGIQPIPSNATLMANALAGSTGVLSNPLFTLAQLGGTSIGKGGSATTLTVDPGVEKGPTGPPGPLSSGRKGKT